MKITTQKTGGIWHGYLEGCPEVDERALTEEIARRKVERRVAALGARVSMNPSDVVRKEGGGPKIQ